MDAKEELLKQRKSTLDWILTWGIVVAVMLIEMFIKSFEMSWSLWLMLVVGAICLVVKILDFFRIRKQLKEL